MSKQTCWNLSKFIKSEVPHLNISAEIFFFCPLHFWQHCGQGTKGTGILLTMLRMNINEEAHWLIWVYQFFENFGIIQGRIYRLFSLFCYFERKKCVNKSRHQPCNIWRFDYILRTQCKIEFWRGNTEVKQPCKIIPQITFFINIL